MSQSSTPAPYCPCNAQDYQQACHDFSRWLKESTQGSPRQSAQLELLRIQEDARLKIRAINEAYEKATLNDATTEDAMSYLAAIPNPSEIEELYEAIARITETHPELREQVETTRVLLKSIACHAGK